MRHRTLDPRDVTDRLHVSRKEGGRRLNTIEDSIDSSIHRPEDYIEKHGRTLIIATGHNTNNKKINRTKINRKYKWEYKQLYERFKRLTSNISLENR